MSERYKKVDGKWVPADEHDITQPPPVDDADDKTVNLPDNVPSSLIVTHPSEMIQNWANVVDELKLKWHVVPTYMTTFSEAILKLNSELNFKAVMEEETQSEVAEFERIRDDTMCDALIYEYQILPLAELVVMNLSDYLDNYEVLTYEEWKKEIQNIHQEVTRYKVACDVLKKLHVNLLKGMKDRLSKANLHNELTQKLDLEYKDKMNQLVEDSNRLENKADRVKKIGSIIGAFTLGIGYAVGKVISKSINEKAEEKRIIAIGKSDQAKIMARVHSLYDEALIPALENFIQGLTHVSQFFVETEQGLAKIAANTCDEEVSMRCFSKVKEVGERLNKDCKRFSKVIPSFMSDIKAAVTENESNLLRMQKWQEDTVKEIRTDYETSPEKRELVEEVIETITDYIAE